MTRMLQHLATALFAVLLTTTTFVTVVSVPETPAPYGLPTLA